MECILSLRCQCLSRRVESACHWVSLTGSSSSIGAHGPYTIPLSSKCTIRDTTLIIAAFFGGIFTFFTWKGRASWNTRLWFFVPSEQPIIHTFVAESLRRSSIDGRGDDEGQKQNKKTACRERRVRIKLSCFPCKSEMGRRQERKTSRLNKVGFTVNKRKFGPSSPFFFINFKFGETETALLPFGWKCIA